MKSLNLGSLSSWPEPCETKAYTPSLNITTLSRDAKSTLWAHLKDNHPEMVKLLTEIKGDPDMQQLIMHFDAQIHLENKYIPNTLKSERA